MVKILQRKLKSEMDLVVRLKHQTSSSDNIMHYQIQEDEIDEKEDIVPIMCIQRQDLHRRTLDRDISCREIELGCIRSR